MSNITTFYFGKTQLRVLIDEQDYPLFVGQDVVAALGSPNSMELIKRKVDDEDRVKLPVNTPSGVQSMIMVNESGLFTLIDKSHSNRAKPFKHWITSEVLSFINKYGASTLNNTGGEEMSDSMTPEQRLDFLNKSMDLMGRLGELPEQDKEVYRASIRALTLEVQPQHESQPQPEQSPQSQQESTEQRYWSVREVGEEMGYSYNDHLIREAGGKASERYKQRYGSEPKELTRERNGKTHRKKLYTERDLPMVKACIQEAYNEQNNALKDYGLRAAVDELRDQNGNH